MLSWFKKKESKPEQKRSFSAGSINRLTADWTTAHSTPNSDVYADMMKIKARSRGLVQNNGYAKKYLSLATSNIVGKDGIKLQCMFKDQNGTFDNVANDMVEDAFDVWAKNCDVTGQISWVEFQCRMVEALVQDGEAIVRMVKNFDNAFGFALQLIEGDQLDINYNDERLNVIMGVEVDAYARPVAYHFTKGHPLREAYDVERLRVPAEEIIHWFKPLRVGQVRGVPLMHAGMSSLSMLDKYQEAELTAARVAAGKMGFYKTPTGNEYMGEKVDNDVIMEVEPGTFEELPQGWDFQAFDPQHPTSAYESFTKSVLRSVASAWGISYESLSNDREGVNYSSIRQGALEERDNWRALQGSMSRRIHERVYAQWLPMAMLKGKVTLPMSKIEKFMNVKWIGRGFQWIDPMKDAQANILLSKNGLKSHSEIVADQGKNIEDVYAQIAREKELREKMGIVTDFDIVLIESENTDGGQNAN